MVSVDKQLCECLDGAISCEWIIVIKIQCELWFFLFLETLIKVITKALIEQYFLACIWNRQQSKFWNERIY